MRLRPKPTAEEGRSTRGTEPITDTAESSRDPKS